MLPVSDMPVPSLGMGRVISERTLPVARTEPLTVVVPEFVPKHWWHWLLHNRVAPRLRAALRARPGTVVVEVPQHLR